MLEKNEKTRNVLLGHCISDNLDFTHEVKIEKRLRSNYDGRFKEFHNMKT